MAKRLRCAEILKEMSMVVPDYPVLARHRKTGTEVCFIIDKERGGWQVFKYNSFGYEFLRIARGFSSEQVVTLIQLLEDGKYAL